jgi:hypothetical protein
MLLSSILQILDEFPAQPQPVEKKEVEPFETVMASAMGKEKGPKEVERENAVVELPGPIAQPSAPAVRLQNFEELLRSVANLEKPEQRVVDMFQ